MNKEKLDVLIEAKRQCDYLYPGMSDSEESYYEGYNSAIDEVLYKASISVDSLEKMKINMEENYYVSDSSYEFDLGFNSAIDELISELPLEEEN